MGTAYNVIVFQHQWKENENSIHYGPLFRIIYEN